MKTQVIALLAILGLHFSQGANLRKSKRGYLLGDHGFDDLNLSQSGWKVSTGDFNLDVDLPLPKRLPTPQIITTKRRPVLTSSFPSYDFVTNSIGKPVMESQEYIPPPSTGTAVLPQMPPPAIPVNAVAANVPASQGATYLGSGSIGVVNLGNGAYALGSGSLGYSENRSRPRPSAMVPVYPPIQAAPNLLPAAVPTPVPSQPGFGGLDFGHPLLNLPQVPQVDQNGYEYLPPNRVGFGTPNPPRPIRIRQQFATPTALQLRPQPQVLQVPQDPQGLQFGHINGIPLV